MPVRYASTTDAVNRSIPLGLSGMSAVNHALPMACKYNVRINQLFNNPYHGMQNTNMNSNQWDWKNWVPIRVNSYSVTVWSHILAFSSTSPHSFLPSLRDTSFMHAIQTRKLGIFSLTNIKHAFKSLQICSQMPLNLIWPFNMKLFTIRLLLYHIKKFSLAEVPLYNLMYLFGNLFRDTLVKLMTREKQH